MSSKLVASILAVRVGCCCRLAWAPPSRVCVGGGKALQTQPVALQDVVRERIPQHHLFNLDGASHGQLLEIPVAPAGVNAFADAATLVALLALLARHAFSPGAHAGPVCSARRIRIAAVLGACGRTIDFDTALMRPLDIRASHEATVNQIALRQAAEALVYRLQHWPHQTTIGTDRSGLHRDNNLLLSGR